MTAPARQGRAVVAATLAAFGLVAAPLLHAELHVRERALARQEAFERLFRLAFQRQRGPGHSEALGRALEDALSGGAALTHEHGAPGQKPRTHQAGSLEHLALAVHAAPPPQPLPRPPQVPERPLHEHVPLHPIPRYLVPERSQGPPRA